MADSQASFITNEDERIAKRGNGTARANRAGQERAHTQDRESTDSVRRAQRRAMLDNINTLLPQPPKMAGYHLFWATTTNTKDTVENRMRLGYSFVTRAELPDFMLNSQKAGEATEDRIMVNEMVLMKINEADWEDDMMYKHHDLPNEAINNLASQVQRMQDGRGKSIGFTGGDFNNGLSDGFASLRGYAAPTLEGVR